MANGVSKEAFCTNISFHFVMLDVDSGLVHPNIVVLKGVCLELLAMVMEFMDLGSLYEYIHNPEKSLDWKLRLKIAHDIAKVSIYAL